MEERSFTWFPKITNLVNQAIEDLDPAMVVELVKAIMDYGAYGIEPETDNMVIKYAFLGIKEDIDNSIAKRERNSRNAKTPRSKLAPTESETERDGATESETERDGATASETERDGATESETERDGATASETERDGATASETERDGATVSETEPNVATVSETEPNVATVSETEPNVATVSETERDEAKTPLYHSIPNHSIPSHTKPESERAKRKRFAPPTRGEAAAYGEEIGLPPGEVDRFLDHFESNGWKVSGKSPMRDWRASMRNWKRNVGTFGQVKEAVHDEYSDL